MTSYPVKLTDEDGPGVPISDDASRVLTELVTYGPLNESACVALLAVTAQSVAVCRWALRRGDRDAHTRATGDLLERTTDALGLLRSLGCATREPATGVWSATLAGQALVNGAGEHEHSTGGTVWT
jgi:hypothetical protein